MIRRIVIFLALCLLPSVALGADVGIVQRKQPGSTTEINNLAINVSRTSNCIRLDLDNKIGFGVSYVNSGGGACTDINMTCQSWVTLDCSGTALNVEIITSTSAAGVSTTKTAGWTHNVATVTEAWGWQVENVVGRSVKCTWTGTAANANDKLTVTRQTSNP